MGVLSTILSGGLNKLVGTVGGIIDGIHTSEEEKGQIALAKMQMELEFRRQSEELSASLEQAMMADLANLREQAKIELSSSDPWVRRARPFFLWIMYGVIAFNYIFPAVAMLFGVTMKAIEIPVDLWYVFGGSFLGYAYFRSKDKQANNNKA